MASIAEGINGACVPHCGRQTPQGWGRISPHVAPCDSYSI